MKKTARLILAALTLTATILTGCSAPFIQVNHHYRDPLAAQAEYLEQMRQESQEALRQDTLATSMRSLEKGCNEVEELNGQTTRLTNNDSSSITTDQVGAPVVTKITTWNGVTSTYVKVEYEYWMDGYLCDMYKVASPLDKDDWKLSGAISPNGHQSECRMREEFRLPIGSNVEVAIEATKANTSWWPERPLKFLIPKGAITSKTVRLLTGHLFCAQDTEIGKLVCDIPERSAER